MIDISFEIGGRRVSPNNIGNSLERAILDGIQKQIFNQLRAVTCPEHQQKPKVRVKGRSLEALHFEIEGCCSSAVENATRRLK